MLTKLIPNIFYPKLQDGVDLFVTCLNFKILYQDAALAVIERDGAKAYIVENAEYAAKDRPEITIETDAIEEIYREIHANHPEILHPNNPVISRKPWGSREFAVLDKTTVCVVFRQFN